jgi:hypothetical protein
MLRSITKSTNASPNHFANPSAHSEVVDRSTPASVRRHQDRAPGRPGAADERDRSSNAARGGITVAELRRPATEVIRRAGHGVAVLLKIYAH